MNVVTTIKKGLQLIQQSQLHNAKAHHGIWQMSRHHALMGVVLCGCAFLMACQDRGDIESISHQNPDGHEGFDTTAHTQEGALPRLPSKHNCPRLLQQQVDNSVIEVQNVLSSAYCDYFVYPMQGQTINVSLQSRLLKVELLRPTWHNFANGVFTATQTGRHVIRVQYDGVQQQPKNLSYTVLVTIQ